MFHLNREERARRAVAAATTDGRATLPTGADLGEPLAIQETPGAIVGWFVPVVRDGEIIAYGQTDHRARFQRFAHFGLAPGATAHPPAATWTDPVHVATMAASVCRADEELADPVLSYDRAPTRVAWAVRATGASGTVSVIYVAGDQIWRGNDPAT